MLYTSRKKKRVSAPEYRFVGKIEAHRISVIVRHDIVVVMGL